MNKQAGRFPLIDITALQEQAANVDNDLTAGISAMLLLGSHYASASAYPQAVDWWGKACQQGEPMGYLNIGRYYAWCCTAAKNLVEKEKYLDSVIVALRPVANPDMPFPEASLHLGLVHEHVARSYQGSDWGTEKQRQDCVNRLFMKAADYFDRATTTPCSPYDPSPATAANALANLHLQNLVGDTIPLPGMATNQQTAFHLFKQAAEAGFGEAMYNLAVLYFHGIGTQSSLEMADKYLLEAVNTIPEDYPTRPGFKFAARRELVWLRSLASGKPPSRPRAVFSPLNLRFSSCDIVGN